MAYPSTTWPTTIDTPITRVNGVDTVNDNDFNYPDDQIVRLQTWLGETGDLIGDGVAATGPGGAVSPIADGGVAFEIAARADFTSGKLLSVGDNYDAAYAEKFFVDFAGKATAAGLTLGATTAVVSILDEDAMGSDSAVALATQQSIKAYVDASGGGFADPMTTRGDLIFKNAAAATVRLAAGTAGQVLTSDGTDIAWAAASSGFADPMTTRGDIIYKNAATATVRLGCGSAGQVLTSDGTDIAWAAASSGFSDPMTTAGDIIYKNPSNVTTRLGHGTVNQVLTTDGTNIAWDDLPSTYWSRGGINLSPVNAGDTITMGTGSVQATSFVFSSDTTSGFLSNGALGVSVVTNSSIKIIIESNGTIKSNLGSGYAALVTSTGDITDKKYVDDAITAAAPAAAVWSRVATNLYPATVGDGVFLSVGSAAAPGLAFVGALTTGLYGSASTLGITVAGVQTADINAQTFEKTHISLTPQIDMFYADPTPNDNDLLGQVRFLGIDSGPDKQVYCYVQGKALDVTAGTEDGEVSIYSMTGGVSGICAQFYGGNIYTPGDVTATVNVNAVNSVLTGVVKIDGTQVVKEQQTGWTAPAAGADKALSNYSGSSPSVQYVQSEAVATDDEVKELNEVLRSLITDLMSHGLIGA